MRIFKAFVFKLLALGMFSAAPVATEAEYVLERPDIETSSSRYKRRFKSPTGEWFLQNQSKHLLAALAPWRGGNVLDIGGGHGQYTELLRQQGFDVTVLGSTPVADEQIRPLIKSGQCRYAVGSLHELPFADRSFDVVLSFRVMAHLRDWKELISEASRVARNAVIVDYPVSSSFNALYPLLFWLKRATEGDTRTYNVFRESEIVAEFVKAGYGVTGRYAQYFMPMAAHRVFHMPRFSDRLEHMFETTGLTEKYGSPIILRVEPLGSKTPPVVSKSGRILYGLPRATPALAHKNESVPKHREVAELDPDYTNVVNLRKRS